jgi:hypothetical protein
MNEEYAKLLGQNKVLLDVCVALISTHPQPERIRAIFEELRAQTFEQASQVGVPASFASGVESVSTRILEALSSDEYRL